MTDSTQVLSVLVYFIMRIIWSAALVALIMVLLSGCDRCSDDQPMDDSLLFVLLDQQGRNLIGTGAEQYHPDSVRLLLAGTTDYSTVEQGEIYDGGYGVRLFPNRPVFNSRDDVRAYLQLTSKDTDTLDITYRIKEGKCFDLIEYNSLFYNGNRMAGRNDFGVSIMRKKR
jgi:hypothetical protein